MPQPEDSDNPLEQALRGLGSLEQVRQRESSAFDAIAGDASKAVIFGCGHLGRFTLSGARQAGIDVVAFADNNASLWGQRIDDIPVVPPAEAVSNHNHDAYFIVAIYNSASPRQQLQGLGCERLVPFPVFVWQFARHMPGDHRVELPHRILERIDDIRRSYRLLGDPQSSGEFVAQIVWRCSLDYDRLPLPSPASEIYFSPGIFRLGEQEVLADCGAFDGDSIRLFLQSTSGSFRHIYAMEPDQANRRSLDSYLTSLPAPDRERVSVLPFGISDHDGEVRFNASGTAGSRMTTDQSAGSIECRRLDGLLEGPSPTIIKMDIEGAEPGALEGATDTIREARPILAVCAYHECEHLWTLPAIISAALPEYQIFLRRYAEECWETVYYAVPPERVVSGDAR